MQDLERIAQETKLNVPREDLVAMIEVAIGQGDIENGVSLEMFANVMKRCGAL